MSDPKKPETNLSSVGKRFNSLRKKLGNKLNHPTTLRVVGAIGTACQHAVHLTSQTSWLGKASIAMSAVGAFVITDPGLRPHYAEHCRLLIPTAGANALFSILYKGEKLEQHYETNSEISFSLGDPDDDEGSIIFISDKPHNAPDHSGRIILYKGLTPDEVLQRIGRALWECYDTPRLVLTMDGNKIELTVDKFEDSAPSALADQIFEEVSAYNDAGYHRSELLVGPPGTGKSFSARRVAQKRGDYSLRVTYGYNTNEVLPLICQILQPRTVIVDDICRGSGDLDTIEETRKVCPLIIATANFVHRLDPAMLRPGRFDMIRVVKMLDAAAVARMLPDTPPEIADRVALLPAAYIEEFRTVKEVHGAAAALARLSEFEERSASGEQSIELDALKTSGGAKDSD